jgi:predicted HTH domain antitoxin
MVIEIPDEVFKLPIDRNKLVIDLAAELYRQEKVSLGRAAEIAGIPKMQMQDEVAHRGIEIHYTMEMYEQDMEAVEWVQKQRHGNS